MIEGTIRCLESLPAGQITARAIAQESGANLASITYHFGSKDVLVTEAVVTGLDRWLEEVSSRMTDVEGADVWTRFLAAAEAVESTRQSHAGLSSSFLGAIAHARHDETVRPLIVEGVLRTRRQVAQLIGFGDDAVGFDTGGLVLSMFYGLLFQALLDPDLAIEGDRLNQAMLRLMGTVASAASEAVER